MSRRLVRIQVMATLALITLPLSGHIHPMMAAARALQAAGHRPVVVGPPDLVARIPEDIDTHTIAAADCPPGALDRRCACLSRMSRPSDIGEMFALVAELSQLYVDHLPAALDALGADAVLHDQLEPAAGLVARAGAREGLAHISLACALPMNREPAVPPPFMGWRYRTGAWGHWLNGGYYNVVNLLLRRQGRVLEAAAARFGLAKPDANPDGSPLQDWQEAWSVQDGLSATHDLAQGLASLDFPRHVAPAYLGPLRDTRTAYPGLDTIAGERDGRPLCFVTLGTLMGARARLLAAMSRAAISRGLQPVVVHGGRLPDSAALPRGTIVRDFLDQRAVLADSAAAIVHGGYNSTTDVVAQGLPFVTLPIAFEQAAIAARVSRARLGRVVGRRGPDLAQRIGLGLSDAARDPAMRAARRSARFEAGAAPGTAGLVRAVDSALHGRALPATLRGGPLASPAPPAPGGVPLPAE